MPDPRNTGRSATPGHGEVAAASAARNRLDQSHRLWHQALESYGRVDDFCLAVNGLLPSLRSVTWLLQKALRHHDEFMAWYAERQQKMSRDAVMRWAVEARNHIEKEGDLELLSTARVSIAASWLAAPYDLFEVPPLISAKEIATALVPRRIPKRIRRDGILVVERRWISIQQPEYELLEACAHVYAVLDRTVAEAELEFVGRTSTPKSIHDLPATGSSCMVAGREERTARLNLQTGEFLSFERVKNEPPTPNELKRAEERYGAAFAAVGQPDNTFISRVQWHHDLGRAILERDGHHILVLFLFRSGNRLQSIVISPRDQQDKFALMEHIADDVIASAADEVIVSGEVWMAEAGEGEEMMFDRPGDRADRTEGFVTYGANRLDEGITFLSPFARRGNAIELQDAETVDGFPNPLRPVRRSWHPGESLRGRILSPSALDAKSEQRPFKTPPLPT
jgi:hypothetical protein